jgi:hypothetical protein
MDTTDITTAYNYDSFTPEKVLPWLNFANSPALGSIVATISVFMLGASFGTIEELLAGEASVNPLLLATSALLIAGSVTLSHILRKREIQSP